MEIANRSGEDTAGGAGASDGTDGGTGVGLDARGGLMLATRARGLPTCPRPGLPRRPAGLPRPMGLGPRATTGLSILPPTENRFGAADPCANELDVSILNERGRFGGGSGSPREGSGLNPRNKFRCASEVWRVGEAWNEDEACCLRVGVMGCCLVGEIGCCLVGEIGCCLVGEIVKCSAETACCLGGEGWNTAVGET